MSRTQVYLGSEELALLDRASQESGASRSELIRRAVRATFGEYVDARRGGDLNERLSRLGVT